MAAPDTVTFDPPPRRDIVADADPGDWSTIRPLLDALERRSPADPDEADAWLADRSAVLALVHGERARRYIRMTRNTRDEEAREAHLAYSRDVMAPVRERADALDRVWLDCPAREEAAADRYRIFDRKVAGRVQLFREENVALQTEETAIMGRYQSLMGDLSVEWEGEERTIQQMTRFLEDPDRDVRERAWRAIWTERLSVADEVADIYDELVSLRERMAENAGFDNYRDYRHLERDRHDYTPQDCERFHDTIEQAVVPAVRRMREARVEALGVDRLRPWDLQVDTSDGPPLRPFDATDELVDGCARVFERVDPDLAAQFRGLAAADRFDLESRPGKAPGGYNYPIADERLPFIFMNASGVHGDVRTLLHEGGHAVHTIACRHLDLIEHRHAGAEFSEVASMGMEHLAGERLDAWYAPDDARRARRRHLEDVLHVFPWVARIDGFQHWIHTHRDHTRDERRAAWLGLADRFDPVVDWTGLEEERALQWQRQQHLFTSAFYYIEYAIAQLGALQVWRADRERGDDAIRDYRAALALGGTRSLPELFEAAGLRFDLGPDLLGDLADRAMDGWEERA